jgi:hypothetical protein
MLMKPDKKQAVSLIMGKMLKKPTETSEAPTENGVEQDDSVALETAAEELMQAIEQKSPKAVVESLRSLIELMDSEPESAEPEEA